MLSPKLETERLILRRYKESDIEVMYEIITDVRLSKYIKFPKLTKSEELDCIKKWISEAADDSLYEKWVIELKSDGTIVGNINVNKITTKDMLVKLGIYEMNNDKLVSDEIQRLSLYLK